MFITQDTTYICAIQMTEAIAVHVAISRIVVDRLQWGFESLLRWGCAYFGFWRLAVLAGLVKEDRCVAAACGDDAGLRLSMGESSLWLLEPMWALFKDLLLANSSTASLLNKHQLGIQVRLLINNHYAHRSYLGTKKPNNY